MLFRSALGVLAAPRRSQVRPQAGEGTAAAEAGRGGFPQEPVGRPSPQGGGDWVPSYRDR